MSGLASRDEHSEHDLAILDRVKGRQEASDKLHRPFRDRWDLYYGLSRNFLALKRLHAGARTENDRDQVLEEARRHYGEELFIPYIYTVIETNLPRILASDPRIITRPNNRRPETQAALEPVKQLFERDQKAMKYDLRLQETVRSGLRFGLGVQKLYWEKRLRNAGRITALEAGDGYKFESGKQVTVFEGPQAESVDIYDFFWDPVAYDLDSCGYVIHRVWLSFEQIEKRVEEGKQMRAEGREGGWAELDLDAIKSRGSNSRRGEVWQGRWQAAGMSSYQPEGGEMYEVWEYHDRDEVHTVLDKDLLVQSGPNPFLHGDFPFQIYRPTIVEHEFVGIGEAEPIAHLQFELNEMRGQRRDAATLALNRGYFFSKGMINPKKIMTGAGVFVPVQGDPREVVQPMPFEDLPGSGVSEEQALKSDIEMTTGISESSTGGGGEATATGTQLVQAAANQRIRQKTKNLHPDLLRPATTQMRELYRMHMTDPASKREIRVPEDQVDPEYLEQIERSPAEKDRITPSGYVFIDCGPDQVQADIEVEPVDGSTEAENAVQKRTEATELANAVAPYQDQLEPRAMLLRIFELFEIDAPEELIAPPGPPPEEAIVQAVGAAMTEAGITEEMVGQILEHALQNQAGEGPEGPPEGGASPAGNGSAPTPEPEPTPTGG